MDSTNPTTTLKSMEEEDKFELLSTEELFNKVKCSNSPDHSSY
jgi:hypothetical protein